jgi:hypothetical protein
MGRGRDSNGTRTRVTNEDYSEDSSPRSAVEKDLQPGEPRDRLAAWMHGIPTLNGTTYADCLATVNQLRGKNIGDNVIEMSIGQGYNAGARSTEYIVKVAHSMYRERVHAG